MYLVQLENSAQCRATQQVFYKLFTFKTILFFVAPVLNIKHLLPYPERKKRLAFAQSFMFCSEKRHKRKFCFKYDVPEVNVLCLKPVQRKIGRFVIGRFVTETIRTCSLTLHA
jgi:hypothetical protein